MSDFDRWDLVVKRDDLSVSEVLPASPAELGPGQVRLAVEKFGLTANNAAYARFGDSDIPFFNAFPGAPEGYGRVPVWGFAVVEESNHPEVAVGTRYYGWVPMSTHYVVTPQVTPRGFMDMNEAKHFLPPWYWTFELAGALVDGPDDLDDQRTLIHPVYPAAYLLADLVAKVASEGARSAVFTSASSKVAIGLAEELKARGVELKITGLTSDANTGFVNGLGLYDDVAAYDDLSSVTVEGPVVFVDLTGAASVRLAVAERFEDDLAATVLIGFTHPDAEVMPPEGLKGPAAEFFFTPAVELHNLEVEGPEAYYARFSASEKRFLASTTSWLTIKQAQGPQAIADAYRAILAGKQSPDASYILRP